MVKLAPLQPEHVAHFYTWLRDRRAQDIALACFLEMADGFPGIENIHPALRLGVGEAIDQLPVSEQALIKLRYFRRFTDQEIAESLGLPLGTVKGRLRRGLRHLRQFWGSISPTATEGRCLGQTKTL